MNTTNETHATRLTIAEAANLDSAKRVVHAMKEHIEGATSHMVRGDVLLELEGNMVIMTLEFDSAVEAMRYTSDRWYRQFVEQTQHLLLGNYVVKLLSNERDQTKAEGKPYTATFHGVPLGSFATKAEADFVEAKARNEEAQS